MGEQLRPTSNNDVVSKAKELYEKHQKLSDDLVEISEKKEAAPILERAALNIAVEIDRTQKINPELQKAFEKEATDVIEYILWLGEGWPRVDDKELDKKVKNAAMWGTGYSTLGFDRLHMFLLQMLGDAAEDADKKSSKLPEKQEQYDANLWQSQQHFRKNEEAYKQQAVNEAREAGVDVNYPPYTDTQKGPETTPDQPQ